MLRRRSNVIRSVSEFLLLRNSEDPDEQTRATTDAADDSVWLGVITHHPDMRRWVAHNKTVPLSILRLLIDDPDPVVRSWVARKRKLDRSMFVALSCDSDEGVRFALSTNAKVPPDVLRLLADDDVDMVAREAKRRLDQRGH